MAWVNLFDFVRLADRGRTSGEQEHHSTAVNRLADFYNVKQHTMTSIVQEILKMQNVNSEIFKILIPSELLLPEKSTSRFIQ